MKPNKIGIFDSGLGGLFVLQEIYNKYPKCEYYYYGDTKNMPYGNKSINDLKTYAKEIISYFADINVDMIICACGTMSTNILGYLCDLSCVPIISVIDPTIKYINDSFYEKILVISTVNTHKSNYFINNCRKNIVSLPLDNLAYIIENNESFNTYLDENLKIEKDIDAIVLGCTHYAKITSYIERKYNIRIINMGKVLAESLVLGNSNIPIVNIFFSKYNDILFANIKQIIRMENIVCQNLLK